MIRQTQNLAVYALTEKGVDLARKLGKSLDNLTIFLPRRIVDTSQNEKAFLSIAQAVKDNFAKFDGHIAITAAGIMVRVLAPIIKSKLTDPAVVVLDQEGKYAVSLLSGHLGGANELAVKVANILGGEAVITTATDSAGLPSLEVLAVSLGLFPENMRALPRVSRAVLEGQPVQLFDPGNRLQPSLAEWSHLFLRLENIPDPSLITDNPVVYVGDQCYDYPDNWLMIRPKTLAIGMGCNKGISLNELQELLFETLKAADLSPQSISCLATVEAKKDEPGLIALSEKLDLPMMIFSSDELNQIQTPNPSMIVKKHIGAKSVCEAAAILANPKGHLVIPKKKSQNATLAVVREDYT